MQLLHGVWTWVHSHPGTLIAIGVVLIQLLNAASLHWTEHKGLMRWLTFVTEVLSILTSRGATASGPYKLPFSSVPPPVPVRWPNGEKP